MVAGIIFDPSWFRAPLVIARGSSFTYENKAMEVRRVAKRVAHALPPEGAQLLMSSWATTPRRRSRDFYARGREPAKRSTASATNIRTTSA